MAGSTPIYGFPYPQPSDLVANYPALGQELAEDIEAVLPTLGGVTLVASQTFTAQSSVSVNNCFTSTYDNYFIKLNVTSSTGNIIQARMRASGTDNTGTYLGWGWRVYGTSPSTQGIYDSQNHFRFGNADSALPGRSVFTIQLFAPQETRETGFTCAGMYSDGSNTYSDNRGGVHTVAAAYDGITFLTNTGTFGGNLRIYGYKD